MDINALHECFLGTLQADQQVRRQAEDQLKQAGKTIGFCGACLDILSAPEVNPVVKKSCAIYLKNKIIKDWAQVIDPDEKPIIRDRIIPTIVHLERQLKNQFIPVLNVLISYDYPSNWPSFLPITLSLFEDMSDIQKLYTGVLCLSELTRHYRWKTNEQRSDELDPFITQYFPSILQLGKLIVADPTTYQGSYEAGEIVKLIVKCYKFSTYYDLPKPLQSQQSLVDWGTFHVELINMKLPQNVMDLDSEDRSLSPWVKSQKWAYANLFRLFQRYGYKSLSKRFTYDEFSETFTKSFVPEILKVYFMKLEQWKNGEAWISDASIFHLISFLEQGIVQKQSWALIKPHALTLVSEVAFPLLCPSEDTLDMFENDPNQYIHVMLDTYEDPNSPQTAVLSFLYILVEKRTKSTLEPILQFIYEKLSSFSGVPETLEVAKQKEAALRIIGSISLFLTSSKSTVLSQMEQFLAAFVLPNFQSEHAFLRARTCEVASKFENLKFTQEQTLSTLFHGVLNCFNSPDSLPVQLEGALAIQAFMGFNQFKEALGSIIIETMETLLALSNKVDSDAVSGVIQECVENYSEQLQPFGDHLMAELSSQLLRYLVEISEAADADPNTVDRGAEEDKQMAAFGVFSTMVTVLLYFEDPEMISKLEQSYAPVIEFTFTHDLEDFYKEAFDLIENTTFMMRDVSPSMWKLFESMMVAVSNNDVLMCLDDMSASLRNYMVYGSATLKANKHYQDAIFQLITGVFNMDPDEDDVGANDIITAAKLASNFILSLDSESVSPYISSLVKDVFRLLSLEDKAHSSPRYRSLLLNVVVSALIIDPSSCLQILVESNTTEQVLSLWFSLIPSLKGVFDLKLSILGFLSLFNIGLNDLKSLKIDGLLPQFGSSLATLFSELPKAIKDMEKRRSEYTSDPDINGDVFENEDDEGFDEDGDDGNTAADDYLQFLDQQSEITAGSSFASQFGLEDDEDDEDPYSNTALDNINVFKAFKDRFVSIQSTDPTKYSMIVSTLTGEQQDILTNIINIASS
ncbi:hypothetical protein CANARDRAFT_9353 [[Candida] arabinofermentans NRRL YB-2248]|uniref:Importin N-terminal domain-containing protein n=1 Tax=[Candida] arabinofermentans NRRL YB-2248 TaxID=983967 RepID=A0A1E4SW98_9ASCO|nr:hypothetical protein CANARDRAFT_9353 [[Candida] arabinofermentans NRRL YB-2248]